MKSFGKAFALWFLALMLFFVAANLVGCIRNRGLLPFRHTGFPFTFAVWGYSVKEFFDWNTLFLNAGIAIATSLTGAFVLAWHRSRSLRILEQNSKDTKNSPQEIP